MTRETTSVVLPIHDGLELARSCVESVLAHTPEPFEIVVVDNGSKEDVAAAAREWRERHPGLVFLRNEANEGFAYACNQGFAAASGEWIALLNSDVVVTEGWLARMRALAERFPDVAAVGPRTNRASGPQVVEGVPYRDLAGLADFAERWGTAHAGKHAFVARLVGLAMLLRRRALEEVGGFDTGYWIGNFEDDDLGLRLLRRGWRLAIAHDAFVHHHGSATWRSAGIDWKRSMEENWRWFCHRWEHDGPLGAPYPALALARRRPFDAERDAVPYRTEEIFHPGAEPLPLSMSAETRFLCIVDGLDSSWKEAVRAFLRAFAPGDPALLILRLEPPTAPVAEEVARGLAALFAESGHTAERSPDILLEVAAIPPRRRGGLYTAATAYVAGRGWRARLFEREARACGLPVVEEPSAVALETVSLAGEAR